MTDDKLRPVKARRKPSKTVSIAVAAAIAAAFASYGAYGILRDDLALPYRHTPVGGYVRSTQYLHFHGTPALLLAVGFFCIAAACVLVVIGQLSLNPGTKIGTVVVAGLVITGFCIIMAMQFLKLLGVV